MWSLEGCRPADVLADNVTPVAERTDGRHRDRIRIPQYLLRPRGAGSRRSPPPWLPPWPVLTPRTRGWCASTTWSRPGRRSSARAPRVVGDLRPGSVQGRMDAVAALDASDIVIVQHEYGIYGGPGRRRDPRSAAPHLGSLHRRAAHRAPRAFRAPAAGCSTRIAGLASAVVVMTHGAAELLTKIYAIEPSKVSVIPHGVASWPLGTTASPARTADAPDLGTHQPRQGHRARDPRDGRTRRAQPTAEVPRARADPPEGAPRVRRRPTG